MPKKPGKMLLVGVPLLCFAVGIARWPQAKDSRDNLPNTVPGTTQPERADVGGTPSSPVPNGPSVEGKKEETSLVTPSEDGALLARNAEIANGICESLIHSVTLGPPLQAKLRIRAWAAGKEVKEVGSYEQAGRGTGWMRMELEVPIADGKGRWQQTCDGRLAWTREELAGHVRVRRVDVGRVAELVRPERVPRLTDSGPLVPGGIDGTKTFVGTESTNRSRDVSPWLRIGGLAELLDRIQVEYDLQVTEGYLEETPMMILKGQMNEARIEEIAAGLQGEFPELVPRHVRVAIPANQTQLPMPARIEFWSRLGGTLLSMIEIYDLTEIEPPPVERFRFEPRGDDFTNETDLYLRRFGFQVAEYLDQGGSSRR